MLVVKMTAEEYETLKNLAVEHTDGNMSLYIRSLIQTKSRGLAIANGKKKESAQTFERPLS